MTYVYAICIIQEELIVFPVCSGETLPGVGAQSAVAQCGQATETRLLSLHCLHIGDGQTCEWCLTMFGMFGSWEAYNNI